ncbi:hypothetical protein JST97_24325 [bacterium]|nr:hypothetical protein [bacterium]
MAGPIGGNFNIPGQKSVSNNRNLGAPAQGNQDAGLPGDLVSISGAPSTPKADKQDRLTSTADPASTPTGFEVSVRSEKPAVNHAPDRLLMGGIQEIGGYTPPADGSGVTGLNSIASVVASGTFQGLNGTYGQRSPFSL